VLGRFADEEKEALHDSIERATSAVTLCQERGLAAAMNAYNQAGNSPN
jgi:peptidyl-tRNA hydrolase